MLLSRAISESAIPNSSDSSRPSFTSGLKGNTAIDLIDDFHDHVLDSVPADPGHGEFRTLWHVFAVAPAYSFITGGDPANDDAVGAAYASHLPAKSELAVNELLESKLPDGSPVAVEIDTDSYFLCAVVNRHAAR